MNKKIVSSIAAAAVIVLKIEAAGKIFLQNRFFPNRGTSSRVYETSERILPVSGSITVIAPYMGWYRLRYFLPILWSVVSRL